MLLTTGEEADEDGSVQGIKISLFNVTDPHEPFEQQKYVFKDFPGAITDVSWDHHAFRYLTDSKKLVIPLSIYNWDYWNDNYDGFLVFDVDFENGITLVGNVAHAYEEVMGNSGGEVCWSEATLPSRSMVFDGELVTFKTHTIVMTSNVNTLNNTVWELNLDKDRDKIKDRCYYYRPY